MPALAFPPLANMQLRRASDHGAHDRNTEPRKNHRLAKLQHSRPLKQAGVGRDHRTCLQALQEVIHNSGKTCTYLGPTQIYAPWVNCFSNSCGT